MQIRLSAPKKGAKDASIAMDVTVDWNVQDEPVDNALQFTNFAVAILNAADQSPVAAALEPFDSKEHKFFGISSGDYIAAVACVDPSGNQAAAPATVTFTVPTVPT